MLVGLELQQIRSNSRISGSGLRFLPVLHEGNQNSCPEEADAIRDLVAEILNSNAMFVDSENKERVIALRDILIIAPYNAQVFELQERLPGGRVGTVDKFQGQQAPVVFISMTASSIDDVPRGISFLLDRNRLNVAVSRAKYAAVIVRSPLLTDYLPGTPTGLTDLGAFLSLTPATCMFA